MSRPVIFTIASPPIAWSRTGGNGKIRFTPKKQREYEQMVSREVKERHIGPQINEPVILVLTFYLPAPKWCRDLDCIVPHCFKPDLDNLIKAIKDGISKSGIWRDDKLVFALKPEQYWTPKQPRIEIEIWPLGNRSPRRPQTKFDLLPEAKRNAVIERLRKRLAK